MNVLILASWYPNSESFVSGVFVKEQVKALKKSGMNPIVFYLYDTSIENGKMVLNVEEGIQTYRGNTDYLKNSKISSLCSIYKSIKMIRKIHMKHNIDLIHSHVCYTAGIIALFYKKLYNTPYIITEHRSNVKEFSQKKYNDLLFKFSYKNSEKVITVSQFLKGELRGLGYTFDGEVVGNVVDINQYRFDKGLRNDDNECFNILFIGSMGINEVKGLNYFLPAFANFINKNPHLQMTLTLVGEGVKRQNYMDYAEKLKIEDKCIFIGNVDKSQIPEFVYNHDFLVLPSVKETFGSVLIEAMASGKPVLTTTCGGPNEFVNDDLGVLVEPKSISELEMGLDSMIKKYHSFNPEKIRQYVEEHYSYEVIGRKLIKIYNEVLD